MAQFPTLPSKVTSTEPAKPAQATSALPALPALPSKTQSSPLTNLQDVAGLLLLAQSRPDLLPQAQAALVERDQSAEREAEMRFRREMELYQAKVSEVTRGKAEELAGRAEKREETRLQLDVDRQKLETEAAAAEAAWRQFQKEQILKSNTERDRDYNLKLQEILGTRYTEAIARVTERAKLEGTGKLNALKSAQQVFSATDAITMTAYNALKVKDPKAAAARYPVLAAAEEAVLTATGGKTLTTTAINRRVVEEMQNDPRVRLLMKEQGLTFEDFVPKESLPARVGELPVEQRLMVANLTKNISGKLLGGELDEAGARRVAIDMRLLGMYGSTTEVIDRIGEAVALYWEEQYGWPREQGEDLLSTLIEQNVSIDALMYNVPVARQLSDIGAVPREIGAVPPKRSKAPWLKYTVPGAPVIEAGKQVIGAFRKREK